MVCAGGWAHIRAVAFSRRKNPPGRGTARRREPAHIGDFSVAACCERFHNLPARECWILRAYVLASQDSRGAGNDSDRIRLVGRAALRGRGSSHDCFWPLPQSLVATGFI